MYGYDTLVAAFQQPEDAPRSVFLAAHPWEAASWDTNTQDAVSGRILRTMNIPGWCQFTYVQDARKKLDEYRVQCSLPKLLHKTNTKTLPLEDAAAAVAKLDRMVREVFPGAPSVSEMTPRRLDATADKDLGDELRVASVLHQLRDQTYRGRRPWVGDKGTINWAAKSGGHRNRVYAKFAESGEEAGRGILRIEREAKGLKSVRADFAKALALAEEAGDLTVGQVLFCPGVAKAIVEPLEAIVDGAMKGEEDVDTVDAFLLLVKSGCSVTRAGTLIGWAAVVQRVGWDNLNISRNSKYEARQLFKAAGIDVASIQFSPWEKKITQTKPATVGEVQRVQKQEADEDGAVAVDAIVFEPTVH